MITEIQYRFLSAIAPVSPQTDIVAAYEGRSKLRTLLGAAFLAKLAGKVVVDFGCGEGSEAVEMGRSGAKSVIGIDIREDVLRLARWKAQAAGVDNVTFGYSVDQPVDVLTSLDAMEHFADPAAILRTMHQMLKPNGEALLSFGPCWYHPLGGHLFSVFPWAHLLMTEEALIRWRATFKTDGAKRFGEVAGGLNQMTIRRFEALVAASNFRLASLELVPIRKLRWLHCKATREFTTAIVRCRLVKSV